MMRRPLGLGAIRLPSHEHKTSRPTMQPISTRDAARSAHSDTRRQAEGRSRCGRRLVVRDALRFRFRHAAPSTSASMSDCRLSNHRRAAGPHIDSRPMKLVGPGRSRDCSLELPQIRTCTLNASGSSRCGIAVPHTTRSFRGDTLMRHGVLGVVPTPRPQRGTPFAPRGPEGPFPRFITTMERCDSLPSLSPHFVSFAWRYHRFVPRSSPSASDVGRGSSWSW